MTPSKYRLYEESVQSPNWQVDYLPQFHEWLTGRKPLSFREDFCGSARISCEWVRRSPKHRALGLDLDREVLDYANAVKRASLTVSEQKRIALRRADVRTRTRETFDWIGAFNYSIFEFHERKELLRYFRAARASLHAQGTIFMEVAGGAGFLAASMDERQIKMPGVGKIIQLWEQHDHDPITGLNDYAIHFKLPRGAMIHNAFTYHWRVWSIREIRDALAEAGFSKSIVLWETEDRKGRPTGELLPAETAPWTDFYIAYVVGVR